MFRRVCERLFDEVDDNAPFKPISHLEFSTKPETSQQQDRWPFVSQEREENSLPFEEGQKLAEPSSVVEVGCHENRESPDAQPDSDETIALSHVSESSNSSTSSSPDSVPGLARAAELVATGQKCKRRKITEQFTCFEASKPGNALPAPADASGNWDKILRKDSLCPPASRNRFLPSNFQAAVVKHTGAARQNQRGVKYGVLVIPLWQGKEVLAILDVDRELKTVQLDDPSLLTSRNLAAWTNWLKKSFATSAPRDSLEPTTSTPTGVPAQMQKLSSFNVGHGNVTELECKWQRLLHSKTHLQSLAPFRCLVCCSNVNMLQELWYGFRWHFSCRGYDYSSFYRLSHNAGKPKSHKSFKQLQSAQFVFVSAHDTDKLPLEIICSTTHCVLFDHFRLLNSSNCLPYQVFVKALFNAPSLYCVTAFEGHTPEQKVKQYLRSLKTTFT